MTALPAIIKPAELALHLGVSERALRVVARQIGACRELGKTMFFTDADVTLILEATRCPSQSTGAAKSGTTAAPSPVGDYAALRAQRTKQPPKESRRKPKPQGGVVISMGRGRT